jgi:large subunit ribosomal protein L23
VQRLFGKKVADVRTMNYDGKPKSRGRAIGGRTVHWKKAVVRLKEGEKIDLV